MSNQPLAERLHNPIIRKFEKRKVRSPFIDNTFVGADLAEMQLISKFNKGFKFVLCVIQSPSIARVWNTHFIIFSFRERDSFPEGIF